MKNKIKLLILLVMVTVTSWAQNTGTFISGDEWHAHKKAIVDIRNGNEAITEGEKKVAVNLTLYFLDATTVNFKEEGIENTLNYSVTSNTFILGNKNYTILELNENILTLQEEGSSGGVIYFEKIDNGDY